MTNQTITRISDDMTYTITLPTDDRAILRLMIELQRDAAAFLLECATRDLDASNEFSINTIYPLTQFDYSGDHDDYNTAAASILADITYALTAHTTDTALDALLEMIDDPTNEFLIDCDTADFNSPLLAAIHNDTYDD